MKTRFLFVRHAESAAREQGVVQGAGLLMPLSEAGKEQAQQLPSALADLTFDHLYTSKAVRAIETARPIHEARPEIPYDELAELNERSKGEAEGMTQEEFAQQYPDIEAAWAREEDPRVADGENFADVEARAMPLLMKHYAEHAGKTLLYVGHGNWFRVALGAMLGIPVHMRNRIALDCASLSIAEYDDERNRWRIIAINRSLV